MIAGWKMQSLSGVGKSDLQGKYLTKLQSVSYHLSSF